MNRLEWRREHQIALLIAAAIGAFLGSVIAYHAVSPYVSMYSGWSEATFGNYGLDWVGFLSHYWLVIVFWPLSCALIGGGIVYIQQLLRA